jgi:anti-sigma B factor antagonist
MQIDVRDASDVCTISPRGELDLRTAPQLDGAIIEAVEGNCSDIEVDLRNLTFMDSTGLRIVTLAYERCQERGKTFSILPEPPRVQRVFEITGLIEMLPFRSPRHAPG